MRVGWSSVRAAGYSATYVASSWFFRYHNDARSSTHQPVTGPGSLESSFRMNERFRKHIVPNNSQNWASYAAVGIAALCFADTILISSRL